MNAMPQIAPVSQVHKEAPVVGAMLKNGPVLLTAKSQRFGVLVDVEQWNAISEKLRRMELHLEALQAARRVERGEEPLIDHAELAKTMAEYAVAA